ncbi:hypothetical protein [Deinococcus aestuarii]|uniref:hypothetical protein n=1 Tax=Deinococcus aestuarii TaxID=2774531 RepID=UPI001C0DC755|nr:hypothetical protein [Deinococcus aestuarii]
MTPSEERWVSACLLARTNFFGRSVPISMRASQPAPAFFRTTPEERAAFSLFEGGFFGNLFLPVPVACVCSGRKTAREAADRVLRDRVCALPSGAQLPTGEQLSFCRFVLMGECGEEASSRWGGSAYREVVFVYLRPAGR